MLQQRLRTQSRAILLPVACFCLLLTNSNDFLALSPHVKIACHLIGFLFFLFVLWNAWQSFLATKVERKRTTSDAWADGATVIAGIALLLCNRFAHLTPMLHGLCDIAGWTLMLFCWFPPTSHWKSVSFAGLYLIFLSRVHWRQFSAFASLNRYAMIAALIAWATISALTYLILSRRKPAPTPQGLH